MLEVAEGARPHMTPPIIPTNLGPIFPATYIIGLWMSFVPPQSGAIHNPYAGLGGECRSVIATNQGYEHEAVIQVCQDHKPFRLPVGTSWVLRTAEGADIVQGGYAGPCDWNLDGFIDGIDFDQFTNAFEAGAITADFNGDTFVDGLDSDLFNNLWESQGMPAPEIVGRPAPVQEKHP